MKIFIVVKSIDVIDSVHSYNIGVYDNEEDAREHVRRNKVEYDHFNVGHTMYWDVIEVWENNECVSKIE